MIDFSLKVYGSMKCVFLFGINIKICAWNPGGASEIRQDKYLKVLGKKLMLVTVSGAD